MWQFHYLLRTDKQHHLHMKGCVRLENRPERRFLGYAISHGHAYQVASQRLNVRASICRLCVDDSVSETGAATLLPPS